MEPPPPLALSFAPPSLSFAPPISVEAAIEEILSLRFGAHFTEGPEGPEVTYTYTPYNPYDHIYTFNTGDTKYLLKISNHDHAELIKHEYGVYQQLYSFARYHEHRKYFLEGVEGGSHKGFSYIFFPFLESTSLEVYIRSKHTHSEVCTILKKVMTALVFLLRNKICHGDLHAGNVLIHGDSVKVIDFDKAGPCDGVMHTGYARVKGRNGLRQNVNFIGTPDSKTTGFFVLCKDIFEQVGIQIDIDSIIEKYLATSKIDEAYGSITDELDKLIGKEQGGKGRRKKRRTQRQKKSRSKRSVL
jgi:serine/threonine protein kinase